MPKTSIKTVKSQKPAKKALKTNVVEAQVKTTSSKRSGGLTVDVYNAKGVIFGSISLPKEVFGAKVNPVLMSQAVRVYLANQRQGNAATKTRGDVDLTTAKWYRQKGTGRARHGAQSAPIFVGGGVAHGPHPHDFSMTMPQKMRQKALLSSLTQKHVDGQVRIVDGLTSLEAKTKNMAILLKTMAVLGKSVLVVTPPLSENGVSNVHKASRNIEGVQLRVASQLNTYEVLRNKTVVVMKDAIETIEKTFVKAK